MRTCLPLFAIAGSLLFLQVVSGPASAREAAAPQVLTGEWNGIAGDDQVDEQWRITSVNGQWAVFGYYFWNEKGVKADPSRVAGDLAGRFKGSDVKVEKGVLKFTQTFGPKPLGNWADVTHIEAAVAGNALLFENEYVKGVKLVREAVQSCGKP